MTFMLARGRPEIGPQSPVVFSGIKDLISTTEWIVKRVTHSLDGSGLRTEIELETKTAEGENDEVVVDE